MPQGLDLSGMVVTQDALHTQWEAARLIREDNKGHYLMIVQGNQPTMLEQAEILSTQVLTLGPRSVTKKKWSL